MLILRLKRVRVWKYLASLDTTWTLGLTIRSTKKSYDLSEVNPQIGVVWNVRDDLRLRGAYFQVMKPVLTSNRTLEPTQIAGFNQYFDDLDATRSTRYGIGADWQPNSVVSLGGELTRRKLKNAAFDFMGNVTFEDRDEWTNRAYAYWTPSPRWALSLEGVYDKFSNDDDSSLAAITPKNVRTEAFRLKSCISILMAYLVV